jgi:hypothetical protein
MYLLLASTPSESLPPTQPAWNPFIMVEFLKKGMESTQEDFYIITIESFSVTFPTGVIAKNKNLFLKLFHQGEEKKTPKKKYNGSIEETIGWTQLQDNWKLYVYLLLLIFHCFLILILLLVYLLLPCNLNSSFSLLPIKLFVCLLIL